MLVATLALIPVLILEADTSGRWQQAAVVANWSIWGVFAAEFALILVAATRRKAALKAHWLDAAIVVVTPPLFGQFLSSLRLLRLARLLRLTRLGLIFARAIQAERTLTTGTTLKLLALISAFIVVVSGAAQATFDAGEFHTVWEGVWWATVTVTTVGYGDLYPTTVFGRLIGIVVMLVGIGFLSVLTATVASHFVKVERNEESTEMLARLARIEGELTSLHALLGEAPTREEERDHSLTA